MFSRTITQATVCCAALMLSACASVVSDNDTTTFVETDPEQATCELHGHNYKNVIETPDSVTLPANAAPVTVACRAEGYKMTTEELDTKLDGWIFGNIIIGGVVGAVVDLARGAGFKYPSSILVYMQPEKFASTEDRDEWFDRRQKSINDEWDKVLETIRNQCGTGTCEDELRRANEKRQEQLDDLEQERQEAIVEAPSA